MNKVNKFLVMVIAMIAIMLVAVAANQGYKTYEGKKKIERLAARHTEVATQVHTVTSTIKQLTEDEEALLAFVDEANQAVDEFDEASDNGSSAAQNTEGMDGTTSSEGADGSISGNQLTVSDNSVSGDGLSSLDDVSWNDDGAGNVMISGNQIVLIDRDQQEETVSGNQSVSGNEAVSDNQTVSGDGLSHPSDVSWAENGAGVVVTGDELPAGNEELSLKEKRLIMGSYQQTLLVNQLDLNTIENSDVDFSKMKIACLGDSITAASNLDSEEDYQQYSYPAKLCEVLGASSVTNLGIGGSSIGRYWDNAFVDRYQDIPQDTDLIIVMGGTNDGFCVTEDEIGNMDDRKPDTFIGDLDELMRGLQENYPDATIVFATPLPNILHDVLRKDRDYLLPQLRLVTIIKDLAAEYEIPVVDLYNSNILDTHDAAIIKNFMPDGVHGNHTGYEILADHFAAQLIKIYDEKQVKDE